MIVTVATYKGGVGKTTTAMHLAAYLQERAPTLLIDGDPNRSATAWVQRGGGLPFKVVDERQATKYVRQYEHIVIDTQAHPNKADLESLSDGCDLLVLPSTPDALSLDALLKTVDMLKSLGSEKYRILLTMIPPRPSRDGEEAQAMLRDSGLPVFDTAVRRLVAFQKAALAGVTVGDAPDPRAADAWANYVAVGKEITP